MSDEQKEAPEATEGETPAAQAMLATPCGAPAPMVVNGGGFVGCQAARGHDGPHGVTFTWQG